MKKFLAVVSLLLTVAMLMATPIYVSAAESSSSTTTTEPKSYGAAADYALNNQDEGYIVYNVPAANVTNGTSHIDGIIDANDPWYNLGNTGAAGVTSMTGAGAAVVAADKFTYYFAQDAEYYYFAIREEADSTTYQNENWFTSRHNYDMRFGFNGDDFTDYVKARIWTIGEYSQPGNHGGVNLYTDGGNAVDVASYNLFKKADGTLLFEDSKYYTESGIAADWNDVVQKEPAARKEETKLAIGDSLTNSNACAAYVYYAEMAINKEAVRKMLNEKCNADLAEGEYPQSIFFSAASSDYYGSLSMEKKTGMNQSQGSVSWNITSPTDGLKAKLAEENITYGTSQTWFPSLVVFDSEKTVYPTTSKMFKVPATATKTPAADGIIEDGEYAAAIDEYRFTTTTQTDAVKKSLARTSEMTYYFSQDEDNIYVAIKNLAGLAYDNQGRVIAINSRSNYTFKFGFNINDKNDYIQYSQNTYHASNAHGITDFVLVSSGNHTTLMYSNGSNVSAGLDEKDVFKANVLYRVVTADGQVREIASGGTLNEGDAAIYQNCGAPYIAFQEMVIDKESVLSLFNEYCGTNYSELPNAMYFGISQTSQYITVSYDADGKATYAWGGNGGAFTYNSNDLIVFSDSDGDIVTTSDVVVPTGSAPTITAKDALKESFGQTVHLTGDTSKDTIVVDGDIGSEEYSYKSATKGASQYFYSDGKYEQSMLLDTSIAMLKSGGTITQLKGISTFSDGLKAKTKAMLESIKYTYYFAESGSSIYIAYNQTGGYAEDANGGQWPCRLKTDIRIGFDPNDYTRYINLYFNGPDVTDAANLKSAFEINEDKIGSTTLVNGDADRSKGETYSDGDLIVAAALKKYYTKTTDKANDGALAVEGTGNNMQKAPAQTFVEIELSKATLLKILQKYDSSITTLPNTFWIDVGATVYWFANNNTADGVVNGTESFAPVGTGTFSTSMMFTGAELSAYDKAALDTTWVHIPDLVVLGNDYSIPGSCTSEDNTTEDKACVYTKHPDTLVEGEDNYHICTYCGAQGLSKIAYTEMVETEGFKADGSEATCTTPATFHYSCICGAKGTETFTGTATIPHTYDQSVTENGDVSYLKEKATCTSQAVYWKSCECGASAGDGSEEDKNNENNVFKYGEMATTGHVYECEVKVSEDGTISYLAKLGNCITESTYYKSCACGASAGDGSDDDKKLTFAGELVPEVHVWKKDYSMTVDCHWLVCDGCGAESAPEVHALTNYVCTTCGYNATPSSGGSTPGGSTPGGSTPGGSTPGGSTPGGTVTPPETTAPETTAPETTAPETTAPETTAPETTAPETTAPETTAPETTAPETTAPETTAPETAAPTTAAPTVAPTTAAPTVAPTTAAPTAAPTTAEATEAPTTAEATEAPTTAGTTAADTTAPVDEGCGGTISFAGLALVAALGACATFATKKKDEE